MHALEVSEEAAHRATLKGCRVLRWEVRNECLLYGTWMCNLATGLTQIVIALSDHRFYFGY